MPAGGPAGASCVQGLDDSLNSAIHTTYRISLRSSSLREPRYPLLKVIYVFRIFQEASAWAGGSPIRRLSIAVALLDGGRPVGRAVGDFMSFDARCLSPLPSRGGTVLFLC
jgi:hypothetical protein